MAPPPVRLDDSENLKWRSMIPVLYDWFCHNHLVWPSLSCRWGPRIEELRFKNKQRLYLSEQTDGSVPNTLVVATVEVVKPRVAAAEHINSFTYANRSPFVRKTKTIIHPGEVNRIREFAQDQNIIATHSDCPEVYIWNLGRQPNRSPKETKEGPSSKDPSRPDLELVGHTADASFALATGQTSPLVLSGGRDKNVLLWNLQDHITTLQDPDYKVNPLSPSPSERMGRERGPSVHPRGAFHGHSDVVEDVQFRPQSKDEFCSVGDDEQLIFWDVREGEGSTSCVKKAHREDIHCVDWNEGNQNLILTGSASGEVKLFDRRKLESTDGASQAVHTFKGHKLAVLSVQWCPDKTSVFATCAEDSVVNVWDSAKVGGNDSGDSAAGQKGEREGVEGLIFKHIGHRERVVDFHWNPVDPWTIASVSIESAAEGGSSLQMWRINDLIHRPKGEALSELERHRSHILN